MASNETFNSSTNEKTDNSFVGSFETILLSEVRKAKSLYWSHDPDYNNMGKNRLEWLMIAEKCKKTVADCVKKWHSLLRIYFSSSPESSWIHTEEFKKFEPYLSNHKLQTPSKVQMSQLLRDLWYNSHDLQKADSTPEERENIWLKISSKCNAIIPGAIMSCKNWQKSWLTVKQNFGLRLYTDPLIHSEIKSNVVGKYTEKETQIIEICRATPWDPLSKIIAALGSNFELGTSKESLMITCKKCLEQKDEILYYGCCSNCCKKPIFCTICEFGGPLVKYKLTDWSKQALELLPLELATSQEISVCSKCTDELNKKATSRWNICRVCTANNTSFLDSLYSAPNDHLRKAFKDATKYEFNEKDGLPGYICKACRGQIKRFTEFVKKFKRTQNTLMHIHFKKFIGDSLNEPNEPELVQDKSEPVMMLYKNIGSVINKQPEASPKLFVDTKLSKMNPICKEVVPVEKIPILRPVQKPESNKISDTSMTFMATESPQLAIKDVFSLQRSNQQKTIQSSTSVFPVAVTQADKMDSNRILNGTNSKLKKKPTSVYKAVNLFPTKISKNTKITPPPPKFILQKTVPKFVMRLKPTTASKPAIFTISEDVPPTASPIATDYEAIEDAPPVFCIPKNVTKTESSSFNPDEVIKIEDTHDSPFDADKIIKIEDTHDSPVDSDEVNEIEDTHDSPVDADKVIKIEDTHDDDNDNPGIELPNADLPLVESTETQKAPPEKHNPNESSTVEPKNNSNTKLVRIKGELVTVKPHPYIVGAFVPVEYNGEQQMSGTGGPIRLKLPVIRKVNTTKNTIHIAKPITISQNTREIITMIPEREELQGIKKPRKYWGTVDEFQVAPLTSKTQSANPVTTVQKPNQKQRTVLVDRRSFKLKKLRIHIKRDKRLHLMASKPMEENYPVFNPYGVSFKYGKLRVPTCK